MTNDVLPLKGQLAAVTGAGSGIGLACALALARSGARLHLIGRGSVHRGADALRGEGHEVSVSLCDFDNVDSVTRVGTDLAEQADVDILVNNVGTISRAPALDVTQSAWNEVLDVNLNAPWALTRAIASGMVARRYGRIISIASLLSFQGGINVVAYATSKHAIAGMTKALANEWGADGVTVNAIAPGYIATDNTAPLRDDPNREQAIRERIPAGRWGRPEDIGGAAAFLAGPDAAYINGHVLVVDGGWMAR